MPSSGEYFIANPGQGTSASRSASTIWRDDRAGAAAQRKNTSVEPTLRKRFNKNCRGTASYVLKLEGNYDGTFQNSTGQLDPNINSAFDYATSMVNAYGQLSNQHKNQLKFDGSYVISSGAPTA